MKITLEVEAVEKPRGYYVDVEDIRLVIEGGEIVGWYAPNGLEEEPVTTGNIVPCDVCCRSGTAVCIFCPACKVCH